MDPAELIIQFRQSILLSVTVQKELYTVHRVWKLEHIH